MKWFKFGKKNNKKNENEDNQEIVLDEKLELNEEVHEEIFESITEVEEKLEIQEEVEEKLQEEVREEVKEEVEVQAEIQEEVQEAREEVQEGVQEEVQEEIIDEVEELQEEVKENKKKSIGFFQKMKDGLSKTRKSIVESVENVLKTFTTIDEELFEELEEILIMADLGVETSTSIISAVRDRVKKEKVSDVSEIKGFISDEITRILTEDIEPLKLETPSVLLVIGVNGVGKTTTIGKLTNYYKSEGMKVMLAAADTFRAAAIDQLEIWGERSNVDVIKHQENADPGAVVFDAVNAAKARKVDLLICDTAGRLHNKKNLMEELRKIHKIISTNYEANREVWLVLDATTGQNALQQAKLFMEVADITGIVLTKLDGTAKGGIVISIKNELKIPVRFIGVGEGIDDLRPFNAKEFAEALFN